MQDSEVSSHDTVFWRRISGTGIVFTILYVPGQILQDKAAPDAALSQAAIVSHSASHGGETIASVFLLAFAVVALAFFLAALSHRLAGPSRDQGHLSLVLTVGGATYGGGLLLSAVTGQAVYDAAIDHQAAVAQTLDRLGSDTWLPAVAGLAMLWLGTGVAGIHSGRLPRWISAVSLVIGVLALLGPLGELALIATPFWVLVLAVFLLLKAPSPRPAAPEPVLEGA